MRQNIPFRAITQTYILIFSVKILFYFKLFRVHVFVRYLPSTIGRPDFVFHVVAFSGSSRYCRTDCIDIQGNGYSGG